MDIDDYLYNPDVYISVVSFKGALICRIILIG